MQHRRNGGRSQRSYSLASGTWGLLAVVAIGLATVGGAAEPPKVDRKTLRWELHKVELYHYDFHKKDWLPGAAGVGDPQRPKRWSVTETSSHIERLKEPGMLDLTWSRPPSEILKGQPFRLTLRASAKQHGRGTVTISPYMLMGAFLVRPVPPGGGKLPAVALDALTQLASPTVPAGLPGVSGAGPNGVRLFVSDDPADKIDANGSVEVEVQLQHSGATREAYLAVNAAGLGMVLYIYKQTEVVGLPDRSHSVWLDRDWGPPGVNTMLCGRGLKIGENYTVSLNGHKLLTRRVPGEIRDVTVREEVGPRTGYRSWGEIGPPRPNTKGELPPHEWIVLPTTQERGPVNILVECEQSGRFELPFLVTSTVRPRSASDMSNENVLTQYLEKIPENLALIRACATPGRLRDWIGRGASTYINYGSINNMFFAGGMPFVSGQSEADFAAFTCGGYQGQVLALLNYLRFNDNVGVRKLIDGWEYAPFQSSCRTHHFCAVWPTHAGAAAANLASWQQSATILDPWIEQKPMAYRVQDYQSSHWFVQPDDYGPGGGTYYHGAYPLTGATEYQDPFITSEAGYRYRDPLKRRILIACPVTVMLTNEAGQRLGAQADGSTVAEFPGSFTQQQLDGQRSFLFCLPAGTYQAEVTGTGAGQVNIACGDGEGGGASAVPAFDMAAGQRARLTVAGAVAEWSVVSPAGQTLRPQPLALGIVPYWSVTLAGAPAGVFVRLAAKVPGPEERPTLTQTDGRGQAWFGGLMPGDYVVEFVGPASQGRRVTASIKLGDTGITPPWDGEAVDVKRFEREQ